MEFIKISSMLIQPFDALSCKKKIEGIIQDILRYSSFTLVHSFNEELVVYSQKTNETVRLEMTPKMAKMTQKMDLIWGSTEAIYPMTSETLESLSIPTLNWAEYTSNFLLKFTRHKCPAYLILHNSKEEDDDLFLSGNRELSHFIKESTEFLFDLTNSMEPKFM